MINIREALNTATAQLLPFMDTARIDAEILLAHILFTTRTYLYTYPEKQLTPAQWQTFLHLISLREQGHPIAYLTELREFWSMPLKVGEDTLIPRPETELLVEICLRLLSNKHNATILDLGTGSGAIALALAYERPDWQLIACDYSKKALHIAKENAARLSLNNIRFYESDWFSEIDEPQLFHAIVSNPPYIAANDPHLKQGDVRFEPTLAFVSGNDGLAALRHIIAHSIARLELDGLLLLEHGHDQKVIVGSMLKDYGYEQIQCWKDWQDNDRVSCGRRRMA